MKINIQLDAAFVFDMLAIEQVKFKKHPTQEQGDRYNYLAEELQWQLGGDKFSEIINSKQYNKMVEINAKIFELVDDIRDGKKFDAKVVDDEVVNRFKAKQELQKKFFDSELGELKYKI